MIKRQTKVTCDTPGCYNGYSWPTFKNSSFVRGYLITHEWQTPKYWFKDDKIYCPICQNLLERVANLNEKTQRRLFLYFMKGRPLTHQMDMIREAFKRLGFDTKFERDETKLTGWFTRYHLKPDDGPVIEEPKRARMKKLTKQMKEYEKYFGPTFYEVVD
jgi:hypothetical protein